MGSRRSGTEGRLDSLDALRGFDMGWIVGGRELVVAAAALTGWGWLEAAARQLHHAEWHGFTAWDLVFPLFLFLAGASFALSLGKRRARGEGDRRIARHVLFRGLLLVALGVLYNVGPILAFGDLRYASVLGRIGLAWMFAALIALRFGARGQLVWVALILVGYWLLLTRVAAPGRASVSLAPGETLVGWLDRFALPGRLHRGIRDPEGILSTVPAVATALLGMGAGRALLGGASWGSAARLALAGGACLLAGWVWSAGFPINKNLWTSSFVLWAAGWSFASLAAFHLAVDVLGIRWPVALFAPIGANALLAYLLERFADPIGRLRALLGAPSPGGELLAAAAALLALWLLLAWMRRRGRFVRI